MYWTPLLVTSVLADAPVIVAHPGPYGCQLSGLSRSLCTWPRGDDDGSSRACRNYSMDSVPHIPAVLGASHSYLFVM